MEHDFLQLKNDFREKLIKYKIPLENRTSLYYGLADSVGRNPKNEELSELLVIALADLNLYISYFDQYDLNEYPELIEQVHSRVKKLKKAIEKECQYQVFWENQILSRKTVPQLKEQDADQNKRLDAEASKLSKIFCDYFELDLKKSGELLGNLLYFVHLSYSYPDYHKIAPYYFWRIMVKHKSRLIKNDHLQFNPDSLWKEQNYNIEQNNQKNFKEYERYANLFLELLNFYKRYEDVKLNYSRFAFCSTCNLLKWMELYGIDGRKQFQTPLLRTLDKFSVSCLENEIPKDFDPYLVYDVDKLEEFTYFDQYLDELLDVTNKVRHYIFEDVDCIMDFMKYIYVDQRKISKIVEETYEKADIEGIFPRKIPLSYRLMYVYDTYCEYTDEILQSKIRSAMKSII